MANLETGGTSSTGQKKKYTKKKWQEFLIQAEARHENNKNPNDDSYDLYRGEFEDVMQKLVGSEELRNSYSMYKRATGTKFAEANYISKSSKKIKKALSKCSIMVMTANPIEEAILHYMIVSRTGQKITHIICGNTSYFVMRWGNYWVAHVHQSHTGADTDMGTNATIYHALKYFTPHVIISLGIAFGIDFNSQNIGDVIVSRRLLPYSQNKRDEDMLKPDRTQDKTIDDWLHVRLNNAIGFMSNVTYGDILSGGSVMSSFEEKDTVCLGYTKADYIVGGEMEGNALFQGAKTYGIPGVVIKGICDWGVAKNDALKNSPTAHKEGRSNVDKIESSDINKEIESCTDKRREPDTNKESSLDIDEETFKDSLQAFAMKKAVEKCDSLFSDRELFSVPKNINVEKLQRKNKAFLGLLIVSQILALFNGMVLIASNYESVHVPTDEFLFAILGLPHSQIIEIGLSIIILCFLFITWIFSRGVVSRFCNLLVHKAYKQKAKKWKTGTDWLTDDII